MILRLEMITEHCSRHVIELYRVWQILLKYPTLIRVEVVGTKEALDRIQRELELAGLCPELGIDLVHDDDIPQG